MPVFRPSSTTNTANTAISVGPSTWPVFIDICWSATAFGNSRRGTMNPVHAWRAGPISANPAPITSVATTSNGTEIRSVTINLPSAPSSTPGITCPAITSGFFR